MMIAILAPLFRHFEGRDPFKKALVLAVPFAANIGGMGTIIGTPPNAVAASVLGQIGHPVTFIGWMLIAVPIVIIMLLVLWFLVIKIFKPRTDHFEMLFPENLVLTWDLVIVVMTFSLTVFLWLTGPLFNIPSAVVALLPIMIFTMFGIIGREDLKKLALVMYRSCGQMIDPSGSQGEQLNHTNFAQWGDLDDVHRMRGTYSEDWTVYWITAHFLNAAAQFEEMGLP